MVTKVVITCLEIKKKHVHTCKVIKTYAKTNIVSTCKVIKKKQNKTKILPKHFSTPPPKKKIPKNNNQKTPNKQKNKRVSAMK